MLRRCLILSLLLHFFALLGVDRLLPSPEGGATTAPARLQANLGRAVAPPEVVPVSVARSNESAVQMHPGQPRQVSAREVKPRLARQHESPRPVAPAVGVPAGRATPETVPADSSPDLSRPAENPPPEAVPSDGLRQYRLTLAREARRFRRYPAIARERAWEGEVVVVLALLPGSEVPTVSLEKSSGHPPLDEQALEMMRQAAGQAALPESLRGRRLRILVPVQFRLDD